MPTEWLNRCGVPYRFYDDGRVEVSGIGFPSYANTGSSADKIAKIWELYGKTIASSAKEHGLKSSWIVGIIYIESGGNPRACSPCVSYLNGKQFCSFAPNCGGPCCAYGLMQFIPGTAKLFGKTGPHYMDVPDDQIRDGAKLISDMLAKYGNDMLTVAKLYNGGSACSGGGITGHGGQSDYVSNFVKAANLFVSLGLEKTQASMAPLAGMAVILTFTSLGYLIYGRSKWTRAQAESLVRKAGL